MAQSIKNFTRTAQGLAQLQRAYGTYVPDSVTTRRHTFFSFVEYPLAGASEFVFFANSIGNSGTTREETNLNVPNSFGTSGFLIQEVSLDYRLGSRAPIGVTDADTLYTEVLQGLFTAGFFRFETNGTTYIEEPQPFIKLPPADGRPNVLIHGATGSVTDNLAHADLNRRDRHAYILDPEIYVAPHQNFTAKLTYPSGSIPVSATNLITANNKLYVGVKLTGIEFRPIG